MIDNLYLRRNQKLVSNELVFFILVGIFCGDLQKHNAIRHAGKQKQ